MEVLVKANAAHRLGIARRTVVGAVLMLFLTGARQRPMEKDAMTPSRETVRFELTSGVVVVDVASLKSMQAALQAFIESAAYPVPLLELRDRFRAELKDSAPWISGGLAGLGIWRLETQDGELTLVRYATPEKVTSYQYLAPLRITDAGWKVIAFEQRRELGPR